MDDLQQVVAHLQEGLAATPGGHPYRAGCFNDLGTCFGDRYTHASSMDDLRQAIVYLQEGLKATPSNHPDRPAHLNNLGSCFRDRCGLTGGADHMRISLRLFLEGAKCSSSLPIQRFVNGRNAMHILSQHRDWKAAATLAKTLFTLLPYLCSRYLNRDDQQHALREFSGFAADFCPLSLKLNEPREALQSGDFSFDEP